MIRMHTNTKNRLVVALIVAMLLAPLALAPLALAPLALAAPEAPRAGKT